MTMNRREFLSAFWKGAKVVGGVYAVAHIDVPLAVLAFESQPKKGLSIDSEIDSYFYQLGLRTDFPYQRIIDILRASPESNSRLESNLNEFPNGIRDQRGQEQLFPGVTIHNEEGELDLIFIGNGHIPYFHKKMVEAGIKPYMISSYQSRNPNPQIMDDVDGMISVVNALTRYPLKPAETGKPSLIVGDTHGEKYLTPFPDPQKLNKLGVTKLYIQAEDVPRYGSAEERINSLKNGFWGKRNLFEYMKQVRAAGIKTEVIGLEPPQNRFGGFEENYILSPPIKINLFLEEKGKMSEGLGTPYF